MDVIDYSQHTIFSKEYTVRTTPLAEACSVGMDAVFMRKTGIVFYGLARVGKTRCAQVLQSRLSGFMPRTYVTRIEVLKKDKSYTNNIAVQIGLAEGCEFKQARELAIVRFDRIVSTIVIRCRERNTNQWILMLDEFQRLRVYDLHQLADMFNMLERKGIKMTVISFAMPSVLGLREEVRKDTDAAKLISRFMSEFVVFRGCTAKSELKLILEALDSSVEYNRSHGMTCTQSFAPAAFSNGFRLADYTSQLWAVLQSNSQGAYKNNLPLEHIFLSIGYLLRRCRKDDRLLFVLTPEDIDFAVRRSNISVFTQENGSKLP